MSDCAKPTIYVVDDDPVSANAMKALLEEAGHHVTTSTDSTTAYDVILETQPDCVVADLMMPGVDGLQLCKQIRGSDQFNSTKFVMVSSKAYEFDQNRSFEFGADGYIRKPLNPETFASRVNRVLTDNVDMTFWGVRGTLPVPGERSLKYGGDTSCVSLEFPKQQFFIFDGGSGIKDLGDWLMSQQRKRIHGKIFISHPHWDHINAIPFFAPLYLQGNEFEILGANQGDTTVRQLISAQMDGVYFPITLTEFAARVYFRDLEEEEFIVDDINVKSMLLSHPGKCLGYRVDYNGRAICYVTDNELFLKSSEFHSKHYEDKLADFCRGSDALITDTTYTDEEYASKEGWGHSCISKVIELADNAEIKTLYLFHHDPAQSDADIDVKFELAKEKLAKRKSKTEVKCPQVGQTFIL